MPNICYFQVITVIIILYFTSKFSLVEFMWTDLYDSPISSSDYNYDNDKTF